MKRRILFLTAWLTALYSTAQTDSINQRIFLIGDAGDLVGDKQPVVEWLKQHVDWDDEKTTVIFLGDNIYPLGMPDEGNPYYDRAKEIINSQIDLVKGKKARAYFVPGNHDWKNGKLGGWQQVMNEQDYINGQSLKNVQAWPLGGCPGPVEVELSDKVVVAFLDSQWWLYVHDKPGPGSNCGARTEDEVITALKEIADSHPNQLLIVAMHHPLYSHGPHGGDYSWKHHIFPFTEFNPHLYIPLPVIGSIYPITRGIFGSLQDVQHPLYKRMIKGIEGVLKEHPYSIHVAGHDHGLQMLMKDSVPYIVSGAGINLSRLYKGKYSLYAERNLGFSELIVYKSGRTETKFYTVNESKDLSTPQFMAQLKTIVPVTPKSSMDSIGKLPGYVADTANAKLKGNTVRNFFLGKNYRAEWTQPVQLPVLDFGTSFGGLIPEKKGGGKQTKSLRVKDKSGKEWALRSIEKFPEAALPADLRQTAFAKNIVADGISASYPYAALSVDVLANAAGVPYLKDSLVYVPDDPRLQRFRNDFKNMMAMMEERIPEGVKKTYNTDDVALELAKDNDTRVAQKEVLKARLLDNFIMDFDRHEGQWDWAFADTGENKTYYVIPKDRDQAFFTNQGILPYLAKASWLVPQLQGFRAKDRNVKTFNKSAINFDRFFLNELSVDDWKMAIDSFLSNMTDAAIDNAMMKQPKEIQILSALQIANTLKQKKAYFRQDMMEYYRFLSKMVTITGSNKREQFTITKNEDGSVHIVVNKMNKEGEAGAKMYDRLFDPKITKELRLYGLEGEDKFIVQGGRSPIKIRLIGGPGNDRFINEGNGGRVIVYDASFEQNTLSGNSGFHKKISKDPEVNRYERLDFKYDVVNPDITAEYNVDDGLYLGAKLEITRQGFRKEPYSVHHYFKANRALKTSSYHFRYNADFMKVIGNNDVLIRSDFRAPVNVTNFYGIGNSTTNNSDPKGRLRYYRTRYNIIDASVLLRRQLQSWMRVNIGPAFEYFKLDSLDNAGKFVANATNGLDHTNLYNTRTYAGGEAFVDINSKNNAVLPTRGFVMYAGLRSLYGLNKYSSNHVTQLKFDMRFYISRTAETRYVLATRFGAGHNIGTYEFEQAQYLSGTDNLRGYRKQRFAGRTMLYNNTELRLKLADFNTYLFPGEIGVQLFNDVGRVWADSESSGRWHDGYGAGVWLSPFKRFVIAASITRSEEEKALPLVTFGFQF